MSEERLNRIESKLDSISEVLVQLARMEERQTSQVAAISNINDRLNSHSTRLTAVENASGKRGIFFSMLDRAFWVSAAVVITKLTNLGMSWK